MKHTFVVLAYKTSEFIDTCIESLKNQTHQSHIIISTSTPSTYITNIAHKHGVPLQVNNNQQGIAADWNFAYNQADTSYVTLAHQDDVYKPDYTQKVLSALEKHKDSLIGFSDYEEIKAGKVIGNSPNLIIKRILFSLFASSKRNLLKFGSPIPCPSVMFNKTNLTDFAFDGSYSINMDWNAWINLAKRPGSFVRVNEKLVQHRIHENSETTKGIREKRRYGDDIRCLSQVWPKPVVPLIARLYTLSYLGNQ